MMSSGFLMQSVLSALYTNTVNAAVNIGEQKETEVVPGLVYGAE